MEIFTKNIKLVTAIQRNHHLLPVINRFDIRLGFGDKTIEEICDQKGINTDFFLDIINAYHNENYFPETELLTFSPLLIVKYLRRTHNHFLQYDLPKLDKLLSTLAIDAEKKNNQLKPIITFYEEYKKELIHHIEDEEENVFPYATELVNDFENNVGQLSIKAQKFSIQNFEKEHSNVEAKINDIKNLIIKYFPPNYDDNNCNEFIIALFRFEKDIVNHARIEDKILIPKVIEIEKRVKNG